MCSCHRLQPASGSLCRSYRPCLWSAFGWSKTARVSAEAETPRAARRALRWRTRRRASSVRPSSTRSRMAARAALSMSGSSAQAWSNTSSARSLRPARSWSVPSWRSALTLATVSGREQHDRELPVLLADGEPHPPAAVPRAPPEHAAAGAGELGEELAVLLREPDRLGFAPALRQPRRQRLQRCLHLDRGRLDDLQAVVPEVLAQPQRAHVVGRGARAVPVPLLLGRKRPGEEVVEDSQLVVDGHARTLTAHSARRTVAVPALAAHPAGTSAPSMAVRSRTPTTAASILAS